MIEELQQPSVIDLEGLLQPIAGENPSGESLRYSGLYDEISEARRADENLVQGEWKTELKIADFGRVIDLAVPALLTRTKDLQIGVWLTEALVKRQGMAGLRDGLKLITGFQDLFWETLHPEVDEGDMEGRANAISWLDTHVAFAVKGAPFTGVAGYSFLDWEDSKTFDIPENLEALSSADQKKYGDLKEQAERERRVTASQWRAEIAATRRIHCEKFNFLIDECWTAYNDLNRVIEEKFDRNQAPGLSGLKKALEDVHGQAKKLLEEKRIEEPDPVLDAAEESESGDGATGGDGKSGGSKGPVKTRQDALRQLAEIADYFQRTEPHSPVSYLVQRAVKWGNMGLDTWLQDVIKDNSIIEQVRQTLGLNTNDNQGAPQ
ncbi:MAG TPA: type VI secretion system protein TssA [Pyrinomonadaceae bacterium]|jgi:type VI secretion system protein ImpA|nr:type VI secretion system protein TssA [Pyrinomonadaceae bacterium]